MSRVPQIWTNTDKEGKGTTYLPIVDADGKLIIDGSSSERPDVTYTWASGYPTQKVEVFSDRTVTTDFTWVNGELTAKDVTVT